ncbi:hypothetical protein BOTBODRAFT_182211 [Botryobasidium botryosum FD-172 SS1]|uniref:Uncharacterized protein n=1 Tax=Botryobasidium botryosum (strain FD-172 SS1) TaxID=930990 RepID=A0A067LRF7_BOTB1|nr:hypothetical protein BOTBODRAFT_182211 [Botryobasidium botryosum FD-172 SS1]
MALSLTRRLFNVCPPHGCHPLILDLWLDAVHRSGALSTGRDTPDIRSLAALCRVLRAAVDEPPAIEPKDWRDLSLSQARRSLPSDQGHLLAELLEGVVLAVYKDLDLPPGPWFILGDVTCWKSEKWPKNGWRYEAENCEIP